MKIENNIRIIELIDTYGKLLTSRQFDIMCSYFFDNLSLSEIGDNYSISRQAVSDSINQSIRSLETYEEKLQIRAKETKLINQLQELMTENNAEEINNKIKSIIDDIRG